LAVAVWAGKTTNAARAATLAAKTNLFDIKANPVSKRYLMQSFWDLTTLK
jgi:hypothetical protein